MLNRKLGILMLTTVLASCTLAPSYERPEAPITESWPRSEVYGPQLPEKEDAKAEQEKDVKLIGWKEFFTDAKLQSLIEKALENNRDLRVAMLNVESARALYRVQRSELIPNVSAGFSYTRQSTPPNANIIGAGTYSTTQYNANIATTAYELDVFGRIRSLNEQALETYFATEEAQEAARISLIAEVANAYLTLLADQTLLEKTKETLTAQEASYDLINKRFENGIGSQLDVEQVATSVQTAKVNLALYERLAMQDRNALTMLVGVPKLDETYGDEKIHEVKILEELPVGLPSQVLLQRPDIQQAEHKLKAANANIGAARAAFFPEISITAAFGFASRDFSNLFESGSDKAWNFAPQATLPIFAVGRNFANLDVSKAERDIAVAEYEKSIQSAFREVADELAARDTLSKQLQAQQALVKSTQNSYDLSNARYKEGIDSYLTVLDSQRSLYIAEQNEITIQQQRWSNLVNLYKALGGGIYSICKEEANGKEIACLKAPTQKEDEEKEEPTLYKVTPVTKKN